MIEVKTVPILRQLPPGGRIKVLQDLAQESFKLLAENQFNNGCIPATLGRHDDPSFYQTVWVKDAARAVQFALDANFRQTFPHLIPSAEQLYLSTIKGVLRLQKSPEQIIRFQSRPGPADEDGYTTIPDDQHTPAIKFFGPDGSIVRNWGHNQPDNWGILLLEAGKGIEEELPVLEAEDFHPGEILTNITSYMVNLHLERFKCRSIWENNLAWSSFSTRHIGLAGLQQMADIWEEIESDSREKNYPLRIRRRDITQAVRSLRLKVNEHPGDYTDEKNHHSAGDLASLIVLNDIDLAHFEQNEILKKVQDAKLENRLGFIRWLGDGWQKENGGTEAKWVMGKPILARYHFRQAIELAAGHPTAGRREIDHGMERMQDIIDIIAENGYIPELYKHDPTTDIFKANNNDLAWTRSYLIEAASAGIVALEKIMELKTK